MLLFFLCFFPLKGVIDIHSEYFCLPAIDKANELVDVLNNTSICYNVLLFVVYAFNFLNYFVLILWTHNQYCTLHLMFQAIT